MQESFSHSFSPYAKLKRGTLLVASPEMDIPFFQRSVVLLCEHSPVGSFGVALNKPIQLKRHHTGSPTANISPTLTNEHVSLCQGGPFAHEQVSILHNCDTHRFLALEIVKQVYLGGSLQFVQDVLHSSYEASLKMCFGYSGWGPQQLEQEFLDGLWLLHPASTELVFHTPQEDLWSKTLFFMGGKYQVYSTIPEDLRVN